ncbi:hypothetical protein ACP70R_011282 [Stipagrostis hirtigluma subsp. patula]
MERPKRGHERWTLRRAVRTWPPRRTLVQLNGFIPCADTWYALGLFPSG